MEVFFGIETILKPFRVFSLAAIGLFLVKTLYGGWRPLHFKADLPLYGIFLYGVLISLWRMPQPFFSERLFESDLQQILIHLATFFVIKNMDLSRAQYIRIFWFLTIGILCNCLYLYNSFFFFGMASRQGGLMDNPNYVALSIVFAIAFLLYRITENTNRKRQFIYAGLLLFLLFIFPVTGSRTGLILLFAISALTFVFVSWRTKIITLLTAAVFAFILTNQGSIQLQFGAVQVLSNRVTSKMASGEQDVRFPIWRGALRAGEEVWFSGVGIGQF
ncbi:MAG: O-antigen ligase family protein, partial [Saprospiraceae bacterium]